MLAKLNKTIINQTKSKLVNLKTGCFAQFLATKNIAVTKLIFTQNSLYIPKLGENWRVNTTQRPINMKTKKTINQRGTCALTINKEGQFVKLTAISE